MSGLLPGQKGAKFMPKGTILKTLEQGSAGVAIMPVDFEKALNLISHQECLVFV